MSDTRKEIFERIYELCFKFGSCNYKETGCSDCPVHVTLVKAETLLDKQEQGLLIELPCKVGDTVYQIHTLPKSNRKVLVEVIADEFFITLCTLEKRFGKTVFLTCSEAEEALAKMGGK